VRFNKPQDRNGSIGPTGSGKPESFDLLGFTHYWARSLRGNWVVKRKTSNGRLSRAVRAIEQWCRGHRHEPLAEQQQTPLQPTAGQIPSAGGGCDPFDLPSCSESMNEEPYALMRARTGLREPRAGNRPRPPRRPNGTSDQRDASDQRDVSGFRKGCENLETFRFIRP
jgi:hypothetical protein